MSHESRKNRAERFEERAARADAESNREFKVARDMQDCIPFGQPILVGHHSEGRDRRFRARMGSHYDKAFILMDTAKELKRKASAALHNTAIYGDDPDAIEKLREKIERLERSHAHMLEANRLIRTKDLVGLVALMGEDRAHTLLNPRFSSRPGFPSYSLANSNAAIRAAKLRLRQLEARLNRPATAIEQDGIRIEESPGDDRLRLFFPGKPDESVRTILKANGFRWSPSVGAWQRNLNNRSRWVAGEVLKEIQNLKK